MKNFVIPAVLAGLMASSFTWAAELPASIKAKGEIVAAIMPNYPPMDFKDPASNELSGVDFDLGNALAQHMGVKMKWQETSFEQMINALTTKRVDIVLSGMTDTAERQKAVDFVDYFTSGSQFYTLEKNKDINEMTDICGKTAGTSRRTTFPAEIAAWSSAHCPADKQIKVIGTEGSADARAQLRQSRINVAVQGSETLPYLAAQEKNTFKIIGTPMVVQFTGIGVSKENAQLRDAIQAALQGMIADGSYQAILKKWELSVGAVDNIAVNKGQ